MGGKYFQLLFSLQTNYTHHTTLSPSFSHTHSSQSHSKHSSQTHSKLLWPSPTDRATDRAPNGEPPQTDDPHSIDPQFVAPTVSLIHPISQSDPPFSPIQPVFHFDLHTSPLIHTPLTYPSVRSTLKFQSDPPHPLFQSDPPSTKADPHTLNPSSLNPPSNP